MQRTSSSWTTSLFSMAATSALMAASVSPPGCAPNPLPAVVPAIHIAVGNPLKEVIRLAFASKVCLGLADTWPDLTSSLDLPNGSMEQVVKAVFPKSYIVVSHSVVNVRSRGAAHSWLDFKLKSFQVQRASLDFNGMQLFFFLRDQVDPQSGYLGSVSGSMATKDNQVGPFTEKNQTVQELLNLLIARSTGGGLWMVDRPPPINEELPKDKPFWKLIPYGGSVQDALDSLGR